MIVNLAVVYNCTFYFAAWVVGVFAKLLGHELYPKLVQSITSLTLNTESLFVLIFST